MRAFILASYSLKRIARHRALALVLFAFPAVSALAAAVSGPGFASRCAWVCPVLFLMLTSGVVLWQKCSDGASGLADAIKCSPLSLRGLAASRLIAGAIILAAQTAILFTVLAIRF